MRLKRGELHEVKQHKAQTHGHDVECHLHHHGRSEFTYQGMQQPATRSIALLRDIMELVSG
jgi:hypothetical protein